MKMNDDNDMQPLLLLGNGSQKVQFFAQTVPVNIYHFYLTGAIEEPEKYTDMVHTIKTAEEHDTIYIYINSPGGQLSTAIQIITAIKNSAAQVITVIEGEAYSAGSLIFLAGHKLVVNSFVSFMAHNYSHGVEGKGSDVTKLVKFSEKYYNEIANAMYKDVLTPEEIALMLEGSDYWFTAEELVKRLNDAGREVITSPEIENSIKTKQKKVSRKKAKPEILLESESK